MSPDRFRALAASHGADASRWPAAERDAAQALLRVRPELQGALADEAALDAWLDASFVAPPDAALLARVAATAPAGGRRSRRWTHWLLPGAGLAGVVLAGSLAGALAVSVALRFIGAPPEPSWMEAGSAFAAVPAAWSEE